ncbi:MAG TPA: type IV pili twitching motility protein PilT, partial [Candidatus Hydrogenedentes bacterium]|nr:type IV pili twitching motility protein PilT [Candidatus Hydrogenedentota bacterium]
LLPLKEGVGRCVAAEVLIGNRTVREFIEQGKSFKEITKLIEEGHEQYGMQSFDQALFDLWKGGRVSAEMALTNATSPRDLKLRMQGMRSG